METLKFNKLLEKIDAEISNKKCNPIVTNEFNFVDKEMNSNQEKNGISLSFSGLNLDVNKYVLCDYKDGKFNQLYTVASSYYNLTVTQNKKVMSLINSKLG